MFLFFQFILTSNVLLSKIYPLFLARSGSPSLMLQPLRLGVHAIGPSCGWFYLLVSGCTLAPTILPSVILNESCLWFSAYIPRWQFFPHPPGVGAAETDMTKSSAAVMVNFENCMIDRSCSMDAVCWINVLIARRWLRFGRLYILAFLGISYPFR
jgi:hypothetical protein